MTDDAIENEQRLADLGAKTADSQVGFVEVADWDNGLVTVVFADGVRQTMPHTGPAPWKGDKVRVTTASQKPSCVAVWPPAIGQIQAVVGGLATVLLDGGTVMDRPFIGVVPGVGDIVHVDHPGRVITGVYSEPPPGTDFIAPPKPAPPAGRQTVRFLPIATANYRGSSYAGQQLEISDSRSAFIFYGTQVRDSIPAGARNLYGGLVLSENWDQVPSTPSKLGTHAWSAGAPGSPPSIYLGGALDIYDGGSIDVSSLIGQLVAGTAFGFAFPASSGWRQFAASADLWVAYDL